MVPTVSTVSRQIQGVAGQVHGARNDIDGVLERVVLIQKDVAALRSRLVDGPVLSASGDLLSPVPRASIAVQAAQKAAVLGKTGLLWAGALGVAAQLVSLYYPKLEGPIQVLLKVLNGTGGAGP